MFWNLGLYVQNLKDLCHLSHLTHTKTSNFKASSQKTSSSFLLHCAPNSVNHPYANINCAKCRGILKGKYHCTHWPPVWLVWNQLYDYWQFLFYLQNRLIQTSQTGGQQYIDTFPFGIPWKSFGTASPMDGKTEWLESL